jgi:hypothetical protein
MRRRAMISEIDLLKKDIPRLEQKFGAKNPFVEVLKAQLAFLQNQRKQQPQKGLYHRWLVKINRFHIQKRNESSDNQL